MPKFLAVWAMLSVDICKSDTLTLNPLNTTCDLDIGTLPRFLTSLRNYRAESRYLQ